MAAFEQKTIVRSYKLRIKNKYKSIVEETENVVTLLQSCVSSFKDEVDTVVNNNDEKFFSLYENLDKDFETYREKLFLLLASLEKNAEDEEITQLEEKQNAASSSNLQQELSACSNKNSSQTFCKTPFYSEASEVTTSSFCSLQEDFSMTQSNLPEMQNSVEITPEINNRHNNFYFHQPQGTTNTKPKYLQYSHDNTESHYLSSESSSYQSFSSGVNTTSLSKTSKNNLGGSRCLETHESEKCDSFGHILDQSQQIKETAGPTILNPLISVPSVITAILSHIVSPDDFWMQLEDSKELSSFQTMEFGKKTSPFSVQPGDFFLALSNKVNMYYRAKVLTEFSVDEKVEVFFIDFGSIQSVPIKNLRILPEAAYQIPMRAFHCSLFDILPASGSWSAESIQKFKEYEGTCEVFVKSYSSGKYGIQLMIERLMGFPIDVSEMLCVDGFAVNKEEFSGSLPTSPLPIDKTSNQQVSHDSGVSVTSNQRLSPCNQRLCFSSEMLHYNSSFISTEPLQTLQRKTYPQVELTEMEHREDLISFESAEIMHTENSYEINVENEFSAPRCLRTDECDCPLHLLVLPTVVQMVEEGRMLVMLSNIVSPGEFYVNLAMEDSVTLDELLEQMTAFYESHYQDYHIAVEDLKEGMFCAGRFYEDQSWYRIKILYVYFEDDNEVYVQVQYIDYGNKAVIRCRDVRPLKPEFFQHPCFALKCSLAGIVPLVSTIEEEFSPWDKNAVEAFHQLANFDRCLTAEIVENSISHLSRETVQVLLWDTEEANDLLINEALVSRGVAAFDSSLINNTQDKIKEEEVLNRWDPMGEEYEDIENSYGVDVDDIGIAISGYKPKDESRICKYFSMRNGYCPKGNNCHFEHVPLAEGGVTRDQEETYSLDPTPSLPASLSHVLVQVSAVVNPGRFYAILPFGNKTADDIDALLNQRSNPESLENVEIRALFEELNEYYSVSPFTENTTVALSYGSIVVAWRSMDSAWHRARIIDVSDIAGPAQVFFVDFGDDSWVPRRKIREILPQYLHAPFQAIECHLSDIEPLGFEKGKSWSIHSINYFKEVVSETVLLAYITNRCGKVLHLTLRNTRQNDHDFISQSLISAGFAQHCSLSTSQGTESIYVPG